jgi:hypothetical protein
MLFVQYKKDDRKIYLIISADYGIINRLYMTRVGHYFYVSENFDSFINRPSLHRVRSLF